MNKISLIRQGKGKNYDYSQDHCFVKVSSDHTNGSLSMVEDTLKPGFFLGRHHHKIMTEVFYVLEGAVEFILDDQSLLLVPGDTLTVPPNVWHAARSEGGAKMLTIFQNGQFDRYLERISELTDADFADADKMEKLAAAFDIYEE
ncbi:MAG: cupin domain-containing protein [Bacteroidota bacterium]